LELGEMYNSRVYEVFKEEREERLMFVVSVPSPCQHEEFTNCSLFLIVSNPSLSLHTGEGLCIVRFILMRIWDYKGFEIK